MMFSHWPTLTASKGRTREGTRGVSVLQRGRPPPDTGTSDQPFPAPHTRRYPPTRAFPKAMAPTGATSRRRARERIPEQIAVQP